MQRAAHAREAAETKVVELRRRDSIRRPSGERWEAMNKEDVKRYDGYFVLLDTTVAGLISRSQAEPLFGRAGLPTNQIAQIWALADVDGEAAR